MFWPFALVVLVLSLQTNALTETERVAQWHADGNVWPPRWQPESDGFQRLMTFREQELMRLPGSHERWENWMQYVQSRLVPKFTPSGFKLATTPANVHKLLNDAVQKALEDWDAIPLEGKIGVIYTGEQQLLPKMVKLGAAQAEVHSLLQPLHEEWAGMALEPTNAYGIRLYQNGSSLTMHYDRTATHVISSIVHVAHEYDDDDKPWPIQIEDHDGNLHSVNLEAGQMLFYESAKCLHGRMETFRGKYYGSIFVHYRPVNRTIWNYTKEDVIRAVPPHWGQGTVEPKGSRWAGSALTVDSRVAEGAPNRVVNGEVIQVTQPHNYPPIVPPPLASSFATVDPASSEL